jgi:hypothetical protein
MNDQIIYAVDFDSKDNTYLIYKNGKLINKIFAEYNIKTSVSICNLIENLTVEFCNDYSSIERKKIIESKDNK